MWWRKEKERGMNRLGSKRMEPEVLTCFFVQNMEQKGSQSSLSNVLGAEVVIEVPVFGSI